MNLTKVFTTLFLISSICGLAHAQSPENTILKNCRITSKQVINQGRNNYLDILGFNQGGDIGLWPYGGRDNETFTLAFIVRDYHWNYNDGAIWQISANHSGLCINRTSDNKISTAVCDPTTPTPWNLFALGDGYYAVRSADWHDFNWDIRGASTDQGAQLIGWSWSGDDNQRFTFQGCTNLYNQVVSPAG